MFIEPLLHLPHEMGPHGIRECGGAVRGDWQICSPVFNQGNYLLFSYCQVILQFSLTWKEYMFILEKIQKLVNKVKRPHNFSTLM